MQMFNPAHPGVIIREFMGDKITVSALAKHLGVTRTNLSLILNGKAGISALMGLKLDEAFGTSEGLWLRMQLQYDMAQARKKKRTKVPLLKLAA
jgi:addiction module HigA family antidote